MLSWMQKTAAWTFSSVRGATLLALLRSMLRATGTWRCSSSRGTAQRAALTWRLVTWLKMARLASTQALLEHWNCHSLKESALILGQAVVEHSQSSGWNVSMQPHPLLMCKPQHAMKASLRRDVFAGALGCFTSRAMACIYTDTLQPISKPQLWQSQQTVMSR